MHPDPGRAEHGADQVGRGAEAEDHPVARTGSPGRSSAPAARRWRSSASAAFEHLDRGGALVTPAA